MFESLLTLSHIVIFEMLNGTIVLFDCKDTLYILVSLYVIFYYWLHGFE